MTIDVFQPFHGEKPEIAEMAIKVLNQICPSIDDLEEALQICGFVVNNLINQIPPDSRKTDMENWIKMVRRGEELLSEEDAGHVPSATTH